MADRYGHVEKISSLLLIGSIIAFMSGTLILISFASPNWLESRPLAYSDFRKLGLWEVCFYRYRHPTYQYEYAFSGCHWIYEKEYRVIWEFLNPPWFMTVQAMMSISFLMSMSSLVLVSIILMNFFRKGHLSFLLAIGLMEFLTTFFIFISVCIFGARANGREWMPNSQYNFFSWSYGLAVVCFFMHLITAFFFSLEWRHRLAIGRRAPDTFNLKPRY